MRGRNDVVKQVQAALEHEARIERQGSSIDLTLRDGMLTLEGEVADVAAKKQALRAAAGIRGVNGINDRLCVAAGPAPGDAATREAICKLLLHNIDFRNCGLRMYAKGQREMLREAGPDGSGLIDVAVADGVITLSGHVISLSHKRLAGVLAWWARGCRDVVNQLVVSPGEEDSDDEIVDALQLVLEADPYVRADEIGIGCADGVVTLEGQVSSHGEKTRAEMDAWCLFAVNSVVNHLEVR